MPNKPTKLAAIAYFNMRDNGETRLSDDVPVFIATSFGRLLSEGGISAFHTSKYPSGTW